MTRKVLGNDPFARGAPLRPADRRSGEARAPAAAAPPSPGGAAVGKSKKPRASSPGEPKVATSDAQAAGAVPAAAPAPETGRPAPVAPLRAVPFVPPSPAEQAARELLETTGERLRHFLEDRLPRLVAAVAQSSFDALGLATTPIPVPEVDPFGMSADFVGRWQPVMARVLHNYFRADLQGFDKLPTHGPALLLCNHSGVLPYDELLLKVAAHEALAALAGAGSDRPVRQIRPLSEDFAINAPFAGSWLNRYGLVRASQDNAERLLRAGHLVAVFPEGAQGIGKLYRQRYQLQRFGRGGFVRLALRTGVPIFPVVLVGGEEAQPVMARVRLPKPLRPSQLPITPTFPWLGPVGLIPLPARWSVQVGDPIDLGHGPAAADDRALVARLTEEMRQRLQSQLDAAVSRRGSVFL